MYRLGGRKFVVFDVGPIGCLPAIARKRAGPKTLCVEEINNVVSIFNAKLALKINQLSSTLRNSTFVLVKNFNFVHDLVENPSRFGFKDSRNPCCIVSEESGACIPDKIPCKDRDGHVFWDAAHPSSAANRIIANEIFNGTSLCTPMNVRKLINAHKL
ncbi:hypothetical protein PVL29_006054 [Vitis rotundifolia]|uniref:GDSL esterase/lipase n=1 Tax=Vitis rotundifolia TaxID=103349 RepID=A0AA39A406_VITRO|nr:hypothetical protein PVL29_006054 [Vitis rotundifolia]